jgi:Protein of unknown function (DUF3435)
MVEVGAVEGCPSWIVPHDLVADSIGCLACSIVSSLARYLVSLAIRDKAFDAVNLTSAQAVFEVRNWGPVQCTPLRWKESMLRTPVFRRVDGQDVSQDKPFPYANLRDSMERQTLDAGMEVPLGPRAFRRWTANEANGTYIPRCRTEDQQVGGEEEEDGPRTSQHDPRQESIRRTLTVVVYGLCLCGEPA